MSQLLALSIGPVQEFIAAGRRAGDLFAGSGLLVGLSRAAAQALPPESLIFPSSAGSEPPNKLLAEISDDVDPAGLAQAARNAAEEELRNGWRRVHIDAAFVDTGLVEDQLTGFLEFYAAWHPIKDGDYEGARKSVDRLLAARKAFRDFQQPLSRATRPKSPLDPSRDCVLRTEKNAVPARLVGRSPLRLKKRETLDAISLIKRAMGSQTDSFPSTSLMAASSILPQARRNDAEAVRLLEKLTLETADINDFSELLFPERQKSLEAELHDAGADGEKNRLGDEAPRLRARVLEAGWDRQKPPECPAYYAILVADGDRMGALLGDLRSAKKHREFSIALHGFACTAKRVVEKHHGRAVYTGGDDVMALLPLNAGIRCADQLRKVFADALAPFCTRGERDDRPESGTLSVGIAIVHHLDSLQASLAHARAAESKAKQCRNSLAIALHTRGGSPAISSDVWRDDLAVHWDEWIERFRCGGLSRGFPYELRNLVREFRGLKSKDESQRNRLGDRLRTEAARIVERKKGATKHEHLPPARIAKDIPLEKIVEDWDQFAEKLVIARFLASYPAAFLENVDA